MFLRFVGCPALGHRGMTGTYPSTRSGSTRAAGPHQRGHAARARCGAAARPQPKLDRKTPRAEGNVSRRQGYRPWWWSSKSVPPPRTRTQARRAPKPRDKPWLTESLCLSGGCVFGPVCDMRMWCDDAWVRMLPHGSWWRVGGGRRRCPACEFHDGARCPTPHRRWR